MGFGVRTTGRISAMFCLLVLLTVSTPAQAQQQFTAWVEMADEILLATEVWLPEGQGPFPTVLVRTPYGRVRDNMTLNVENGYAVAVQECRGTGDSQGEVYFYKDEQTDGHAAIEWVARQPWSDGKVGMVGSSALGATQYAVAEGAPTALKCLRPGKESPDRYHTFCFREERYDTNWSSPGFRARVCSTYSTTSSSTACSTPGGTTWPGSPLRRQFKSPFCTSAGGSTSPSRARSTPSPSPSTRGGPEPPVFSIS